MHGFQILKVWYKLNVSIEFDLMIGLTFLKYIFTFLYPKILPD